MVFLKHSTIRSLAHQLVSCLNHLFFCSHWLVSKYLGTLPNKKTYKTPVIIERKAFLNVRNFILRLGNYAFILGVLKVKNYAKS